MRLNEPAIDLAIVCAIISSYKNFAVSPKTIMFGEVGLTRGGTGGKYGGAAGGGGKKLGFSMCLVPQVNLKNVSGISGITVIGISSVQDVLKYIKG